MGRKLSVGVIALTALAHAGVAAAANGGFTPPQAHSPNLQHTNTAYFVVLGFTAAVFLIVEGTLVYFVWRYRAGRRDRTVEGPQVHGNTRLELIWTVIPVVILAIIAAVIFTLLPGISNAPAATNAVDVTVVGHQFYWEFDYPNGMYSINDLHVPVNTVVNLRVRSGDVVHSWWIPQLAGKIQAIPGRTNHTWFKADAVGTYSGQCAELCGIYHSSMAARVIVTSPQEYRTYISRTAAKDLGRSEFEGACATCHGMQGQGGYGPAINSNPILTQPAALDALIRAGRGKMPPVGDTWTAQEMAAINAFAKTHVYRGTATSGG